MEKIKLQVSGSQIQVVERPGALTAGMVGIAAEFSFDSHWDNLGKTVIFRAGDKVITAALKGNAHIVPWEVLEKPDLWLVVGIYGANAEGTVVIPTLWTKVAAVYNGVEPEGDPALEPSNPIWQETLARVANMEPQVQEHIHNKDNPHGISCDQIGAVTQKEFRDVVSNLDGSSDSEGLIPHLLNRENPHGVTAAQAGAAPAGFGLGESATAQNWDTQSRNGFYREKMNGPDGVNMWYGITCSSFSTECTNIAFNPGLVNGSTMAIRHRKGSNPAEWEYVNPPMIEGEEYRTTERYLGKPVYTKIVNFGTLPNNGYKGIPHGVNLSRAIRYEIIAKNSDYMLKGHKDIAYVAIENANIALSTTGDLSAYDVYFAIWYIKD